ncbi:MAG: hypothetical protein WBP72_01185 [Rhodocyclaceae bacterium]
MLDNQSAAFGVSIGDHDAPWDGIPPLADSQKASGADYRVRHTPNSGVEDEIFDLANIAAVGVVDDIPDDFSRTWEHIS